MNFPEDAYQNNLAYVSGIFTLGGLSECGKSAAGYHFATLGIRRSKIIQIEHDMMRGKGIDPTQGLTPENYDNLYKENPDAAFREFLFRLIERMKAEGFRYASLESLYRAPLGAFIKRELGARAANIFIDAPFEDRVQREFVKANKTAAEQGLPALSLDEMRQKVSEKDAFKTARCALDVKDIADYVVDNGHTVTLEAFYEKLTGIAKALGIAPQGVPASP